MAERRAQKILLVAWDAAELSLINPLVDAGEMPNLSRIFEQGSLGKLATLQPLLAPVLWTSVATGKRPELHNVLAEIEPNDNGSGARPITNTRRLTRALWNILSAETLRTHVIGWPASHPAENVKGMVVSDSFNKATAPFGETWPLAPGAIHPAAESETFAELRFHPAEFSIEQLRAFVPEIDRLQDDPLVHALAHRIAEALTTQFAATYAMDAEPWDFAAVYFDALDPICREFLPFHPPRLPQIDPARFEIFKHVVDETYRFYDQMLGRLLEVAGDDVTVIVCSASGYYTGEQRPVVSAEEHAAGAIVHRPTGFAALHGQAIRPDDLFYGANILGVAPTILALLGLPIATDMQAPPWFQALDKIEFETRSTWESAPPRAAAKIEALDEAARAAAEEIDYNLGVCFLTTNRPIEALPHLEQMVCAQPHRTSAVLNLISCYQALGRTDDARGLLEAQAAKPSGGLREREGKRSKFVPQWEVMRGLLAWQEMKVEEALAHFEKAQVASPQMPGMHLQLGRVYVALRRPADARLAFARALEIDPESVEAHLGLALLLYRAREFENAAAHSMQAAGRAPELIQAHLALGLSLAHLRQYEQAIMALSNALERAPQQRNAHRVLAWLYRKMPDHAARADMHRHIAQEIGRRRRTAQN